MDRATAIAEAHSKRAEIRERKRASRALREQAKAGMRELADFCRKHRIEFVLEEGGEAVHTATPSPRASDGEVRHTKLGTFRVEQ